VSAIHDLQARLHDHLEALPRVTCRPEFGSQVFYVGGTQFAALTDRSALLRLAAADLTTALRRGLVRPFVSAGAMGRNGWVEVALDPARAAEIEALLTASHAAASHAHRRTRPRHPARARRRGSGAPS
jgi:TfoX/Sxy family transcriptional regulator of competence genes